MRCLEKRPADRFQTADDLVLALEPLTTPSGGTTPYAAVPHETAVTVSRAPRGVLIAVGAVVLAATGFGASRLLAPTPLNIEVGKSRQVTRDPIPEIHVAISPDGREVAYQSGWVSYTSHIEVRDIDGGKALSLTGGWQGAQVFPRWMPEGRSVVVMHGYATADRAAGLWKLPRLGGEAVRADSADQLALSHGMDIRALESDSTTSAVKDALSPTARVRGDGSAVAFMAGNGAYVSAWTNIAPSAIWVRVKGKPPVRVTDDVSLNAFPAWLPDGSLLYVSNKDGGRDIWVVSLDRDGNPREATRKRLTTGLDAYSISIADDGRTLAYDRMTVRQNIYAIAIPASGVASVRDARPVTTGNQMVESFVLSRDGKWLAFDSNIAGNQEIFMMPAGGGEARRVTRNAGGNFAPDLSGDASQITFHSTRNGNRDIYLINADGSGEQRLTSDSAESRYPAFSPDGLRITFYNQGSAVQLLERASLTAPWQGPTRILRTNSMPPRWSPDGRQLAFSVDTAPGRIDVMPLGGVPRPMFSGLNALPEWAPDGRSIYYAGPVDITGSGIYRVPVAGGAPQLVVRFDAPQLQLGVYSALAIGNGKVYFVVRELESDIYVMELVRK